VIEAPRIAETQDQPIACIALLVARDEIQTVMGPAIREIFDALAAQGMAPAGPWFTHHRRRPAETFDFEVCVPVAKPVRAVGRVRPGRLPAARVARTIYHGPYEGLGDAWSAFCDWIDANGHTPREDLWECYLVGPESSDDPAQWRTELNRPLVP
jgi:effector-binding domain-containing protein